MKHFISVTQHFPGFEGQKWKDVDEAAQEWKAEGGGRQMHRRENKIKMGHEGRIKSTSEVKQARGKEARKEQRESELLWGWMWWLCGACVSRVPGGAPVWRCMGGGRIRSAVAQEEEEEEDGAKQGLSLIHLALSPFFYLHRLKLPQIPLTRNPLSAASHPKGSWHNSPLGAHAWALLGRRNGLWKNCTEPTEGQLLLSPGKITDSALL